jgi:hypothetical protein
LDTSLKEKQLASVNQDPVLVSTQERMHVSTQERMHDIPMRISLKGKAPLAESLDELDNVNQEPITVSTQQQQQLSVDGQGRSGGASAAAMMQEVIPRRDSAAGIARLSGLMCIVGMALLAFVSRRRRRQRYTEIANPAEGTVIQEEMV